MANIPLPGVDPSPIKEFFELREQTRSDSGGNDILGFYNMFTGGALLNGALFALGIMPYISASIIMQLMGAVFLTLPVSNKRVNLVDKKYHNIPAI